MVRARPSAHGWPLHLPIARCLELIFHVVMFVLKHKVLVLMAHLRVFFFVRVEGFRANGEGCGLVRV